MAEPSSFLNSVRGTAIWVVLSAARMHGSTRTMRNYTARLSE